MNIIVPDPHPGRCLNTRQYHGPHGHIQILRCLDYEGTPHTCTFPKIHVEDGRDWGVYSIDPPKPKTWVKPDGS